MTKEQLAFVAHLAQALNKYQLATIRSEAMAAVLASNIEPERAWAEAVLTTLVRDGHLKP
jgi:hypothetical protein